MFRNLLLTAALFIPSVAHADWYVASSKHFLVYSDDNNESLTSYTQRLEKFDKALRILRGVPDRAVSPSSRVTVYVVKDVAAVRDLFGKGGRNIAGFYDPRASGSVAFVPQRGDGDSIYALDAQSIFLHEYSHHFMFANWGQAAFPFWFIEGFAEFHATARFKPDGSVVFGAVPLYRAYGVDRANSMPASKMLRPDPGKMSDEERGVIYARAWLLTHYMTFDDNRRKALADYIAAINDGKSPEEVSGMLGSPSNLDLKLNSYLKRPSLPSATLTAEQLKIGEVKVRALTPGEVATIPAWIRSQRGVDTAGAKVVLGLARKSTGAYPADAAAQNVLAEAELDAGNPAEAIAACDRALAVDPQSIHALLYKGLALTEIATKAGSTDAKQWQTIRKLYLAANKIDPDDPQPLILFYRSFISAKQKPTANAGAGLLYAYQLAPFDLGLRITAAKLLLEQDKVQDAKIALKPAAYNPHGGPIGELATKILAAIDTGGATAGLTVLTAEQEKAEREAKEGKGSKDPKGKDPKG
ncbi:tetratricopeptide (TPR) repeat protein [Sphingomonas sp. UYAg733]